MVKTTIKEIKGLKKVCGETKCLSLHDRYNRRLQINYDCSTGEVWGDLHYGVNPSWTEYRDANIITVCTTCEPMTMAQIEEEISCAV